MENYLRKSQTEICFQRRFKLASLCPFLSSVDSKFHLPGVEVKEKCPKDLRLDFDKLYYFCHLTNILCIFLGFLVALIYIAQKSS